MLMVSEEPILCSGHVPYNGLASHNQPICPAPKQSTKRVTITLVSTCIGLGEHKIQLFDEDGKEITLR